MTFSYEPGVVVPISLSLPIGARHGRQAALRYLENLLPEWPGVRMAMSEATGADPTSVFDLLASVDSAGGLVFTRTPEEPDPAWPPAVVMTDADMASQVMRVRTGAGAYLSADGRSRFSIAGRQGKFAAAYRDGRWFWPSAAMPSTHVLKPDQIHVGRVARVEHACMVLAAAMGRPVPSSRCLAVRGTDVYVVSRFDRERSSDGSIRRIHVEDLCQSLGIAPQQRYEPRAVDVVRVLRDGGMSERDVSEWFSQMACSALLGNCDAHAKNYSVFLDDAGLRPCPMYDVVSTMVWPLYDTRLAMSVNGREHSSDIGLDDWRAEARSCGIDPDAAEWSVRDMAARLRDALPTAEAGLGVRLGGRLHEVVAETTSRLSLDLGFRVAPDPRGFVTRGLADSDGPAGADGGETARHGHALADGGGQGHPMTDGGGGSGGPR